MNGCHNRTDYALSTMQQSGWTEDGRRNMVEIKAVMNPDCQYSQDPLVGQSDPQCAGCERKQTNPPATAQPEKENHEQQI